MEVGLWGGAAMGTVGGGACTLLGITTVEVEVFCCCKVDGLTFSVGIEAPLVTKGGGGVLVSLSCLFRPKPRATLAAVEGFFSILS